LRRHPRCVSIGMHSCGRPGPATPECGRRSGRSVGSTLVGSSSPRAVGSILLWAVLVSSCCTRRQHRTLGTVQLVAQTCKIGIGAPHRREARISAVERSAAACGRRNGHSHPLPVINRNVAPVSHCFAARCAVLRHIIVGCKTVRYAAICRSVPPRLPEPRALRFRALWC
jgi:hypothetical protein